MKKNYHKILVGLDGSMESIKAFDQALQVAKTEQAELLLASVIDMRSFQAVAMMSASTIENDESDHEKGARALLEEFAQEAKAYGVEKVSTLLEYGSPKVAMATKIPAQEKVDLIMVGATGLSYLERIVVGSVASYIVSHAPCDTLIVRK